MSRQERRKILRFGPQPGPQTEFLSCPADIVIYGGSAGGGKTFAAILDPLRHVHNPLFRAVIFRRTSPQITSPGGLWDEATGIYPLLGAEMRYGDLESRFPSGATISFRHLIHEKTKLDWQGSQVVGFYFEELTHFTESQFWYMTSRSRSGSGIRPYLRATTNPDAGSWVKVLIAPWVDKKYPDPARSGEIRWFIRKNGTLIWARSAAELQAKHPGCDPKSITFIRASVHDNKKLLAKDPGYLGWLQSLPTVERERLLNGNWDVVCEGLVYPGFGECLVPPAQWPAALGRWNQGGLDFGFNNPFAAIAGHLDSTDVLWLGWERYEAGLSMAQIASCLPMMGGQGPRWWADPAGAALINELRIAGHDVTSCTHIGGNAVMAGIAQVTDRIRTGRLKVHGDLAHLLSESTKYRFQPPKPGVQTERVVKENDHLMDALRYLVAGIDRGKAAQDERPSRQARAAGIVSKIREDRARAEAHADPEAAHWWGPGFEDD